MIHDSTLPSKKIHDLDHEVFVASKRPKLGGAETPPECHKLQRKAMTIGINKNKILDEYSLVCQKNGTLHRTAAVKQGEPNKKPTTYPTIAQLVRDCKMKPSPNHQYQVDDLTLDNVIVILIREETSYLSPICLANISILNKLYREMTRDVFRL